MSFDLFCKVIDELIALNPEFCQENVVWLHHFGESLVHPDFDRFIRYARVNGVRPALSINPIVLKRPIAQRLLDVEPDLLYLSLDGHNNSSFEAIRGIANAYDDSRIRLLEFLALKKALGSRTKIVVSMIDFDSNWESIKQMKAYWESLEGVDEFFAKPFSKWDGSAEEINVMTGRGVGTTRVRRWDRVACNFPWETLTVTWNGDVVPCCYDYNAKYVLGNVDKQSLMDIWNGQRMKELRQQFINNNVTASLCMSCEMLHR